MAKWGFESLPGSMTATPIRLTVELVPETAWGSNLRTLLGPADWKTCQQFVYAKSGRRCEVCGGKGERWPVECHEMWEYDDDRQVQTLVGLIALCPTCHRCKHAGFAESQGRIGEVVAHLQQVNGWLLDQAMGYLVYVFDVWRSRSTYDWHLDTTWLFTIGLSGGTYTPEERLALR